MAALLEAGVPLPAKLFDQPETVPDPAMRSLLRAVQAAYGALEHGNTLLEHPPGTLGATLATSKRESSQEPPVGPSFDACGPKIATFEIEVSGGDAEVMVIARGEAPGDLQAAVFEATAGTLMVRLTGAMMSEAPHGGARLALAPGRYTVDVHTAEVFTGIHTKPEPADERGATAPPDDPAGHGAEASGADAWCLDFHSDTAVRVSMAGVAG